MIILDSMQQYSPEWYAARMGIVTASEFHRIITPSTGKVSTQAETYMYRLLGEWLTGEPEEGYNNHWMKRGRNLEDEARAYFELQSGRAVRQVGFIYKDETRLVGCSPDGLLDNAGLEIKIPSSGVHVRYLLGGAVPNDYIPQIQGGLWITEGEKWHFLSYHPNAAPMLIIVGRDETYIRKLRAAVGAFVEKMCELREELIRQGLKTCQLTAGESK